MGRKSKKQIEAEAEAVAAKEVTTPEEVVTETTPEEVATETETAPEEVVTETETETENASTDHEGKTCADCGRMYSVEHNGKIIRKCPLRPFAIPESTPACEHMEKKEEGE